MDQCNCMNAVEANENLMLYVEGASDKCKKCDNLVYDNATGIMTCEFLMKGVDTTNEVQ